MFLLYMNVPEFNCIEGMEEKTVLVDLDIASPSSSFSDLALRFIIAWWEYNPREPNTVFV